MGYYIVTWKHSTYSLIHAETHEGTTMYVSHALAHQPPEPWFRIVFLSKRAGHTKTIYDWSNISETGWPVTFFIGHVHVIYGMWFVSNSDSHIPSKS